MKSDNNDRQILTHITTLAARSGETLHALALRMQKDYSTLWRIEPPPTASKEPAKVISFDILAALCNALECTPGDILTLPGDAPFIIRDLCALLNCKPSEIFGRVQFIMEHTIAPSSNGSKKKEAPEHLAKMNGAKVHVSKIKGGRVSIPAEALRDGGQIVSARSLAAKNREQRKREQREASLNATREAVKGNKRR